MRTFARNLSHSLGAYLSHWPGDGGCLSGAAHLWPEFLQRLPDATYFGTIESKTN